MNTTSSTTARAHSASAICATVTGLKVPGNTPTRQGLRAERQKNSILNQSNTKPAQVAHASVLANTGGQAQFFRPFQQAIRQREKPHSVPSSAGKSVRTMAQFNTVHGSFLYLPQKTPRAQD